MKAKYAFALVVCALTAAAVVQAAGPSVFTANIPFEFTAANKMLPAGQYEISANPYSGHLIIRNPAAGVAVITPVRKEQASSNEKAGNVLLVFHRYGNEYFFSQLLSGADNETYVAPFSPAESRLARTGFPPITDFVAALRISR